MYAPLDLTTVDAGGSVLLAGSAAADVRDHLLETLAEPRYAVVLLATADGADAASELVDGGVSADALGVVDASSSAPAPADVAAVDAVDGPAALSDLGVAASEHVERLDARYDRLAVGLHSVTALLEDQQVPAVFRFLHVLAGRANAADATFVATIDRTAHDDDTVATVAELFDDVVEVSDAGPSA